MNDILFVIFTPAAKNLCFRTGFYEFSKALFLNVFIPIVNTEVTERMAVGGNLGPSPPPCSFRPGND